MPTWSSSTILKPLPLIAYERHASPWVWRCHVDLSQPNPQIWEYLRTFVKQYDAIVLSLPEYARELQTPQFYYAGNRCLLHQERRDEQSPG